MMSGTFLGSDFGTKSTSVAAGQRITATARPLSVLKARDGKLDWNITGKLLKKWQPEVMIIGLPLNMDGTEQPLTAHTWNFANKIRDHFGVVIVPHDGRLGTVGTRAGLFKHGGYRALNKGSIDSASIMVILESCFEQSS